MQPDIPPQKRSRASAVQPLKKVDIADFRYCALICVDFQEGQPHKVRPEDILPEHRKMGYTAEDETAALEYCYNTALPNAARVVEAFREKKLPVIIVHWGYRLRDGMDLDPAVRRSFLQNLGNDPARWGHRIDNPGSQPAAALKVRETDYVIAKTAQDAFTSSNIDFVLRNLEVRTVFLMGGHTHGCLLGTSRSAVARGYRTVCIEDATFDLGEKRRHEGIRIVPYDRVVKTEDVLRAIRSVPARIDAR